MAWQAGAARLLCYDVHTPVHKHARFLTTACCAALRRPDIDFCFGGKRSVEEIYAELERSGGHWGIDTIAQMSK